MTSRHHHSVTNVQKNKRIQTKNKSNTMEHLHHSWKFSCFLLLEMKQDQKHNLVQRSQHFFLKKKNKQTKNISLMYTKPAAGSLRHKCYDPGKPNNHTTVQFLIMLQWSYHQVYYSPLKKQEDSTSEKKVPQDIIIRADIYIHMYIYIHPITEIHASLWRKHHVFSTK